MFPVLFRIGGFTVTSFGVMIALAFVAGGWILGKELHRKGQDPEHAWDLAGWAAIFGILGAKIYYLLLNWQQTVADPRHMVFSRSGLVWYGGFILAALAILWRLFQTTRAGDVARTLALGLVCGGAIGNLIDRVRSPLGVVDFIDVGIGDMRWPTFNVADMAVSVGAFLLAWVLWGEDRQAAAAHRSPAPTPAPAGSAPSGRDPRDLS